MLVRVTATIIGIDGVQDDEARARRLMACVDGFISATQVRYSTRDPEEVIPEALEAVRIYREELFDPSVARRQALIDAGDEVPDDLIARQLQPDAQDLWDEDTAWRDTLTIFAGGLQTTAVAVAQSVDEFFAWPEHDLQMLEDPDMVRAVVNETLRLKPPVPYILRRAKADITLRTGREIAAGQELALDVTAANRETAVFGADADVFRPGRFRELPPRYPQYGLAFGAGSHVCYGKPLATVGGVDRRESDVPRVVTKVFDALVSAGVRPAPDHAPDKEASYRDIFRTYPVVFPVASRA
jgi:cytochrome P450